MAESSPKSVENTAGKGAISPFPTEFFYCRHEITRACLGKG